MLVGGLFAVALGALVLGALARGLGTRDAAQRAADLGALAGARAMREAYARLFEPPVIGRRANPRHLEKSGYLAAGRAAAVRVAAANGAPGAVVSFPDAETIAPVRVRVAVERRIVIGGRSIQVRADAEAELAPPAGVGPPAFGSGGYDGPLAYRQGKPMRPDVAQAFDRMAAAARTDGISLIVTSAFRTDAEQAVLFARHPDPKWVAPPGESLHRNATELDLGPRSARGWLAEHAPRFHFRQRYAWEPWHWGYVLNPRSSPRARGSSAAASAGDGASGATLGGLPDFVPARFAPALNRAAQSWSVSATLLAAQIYVESGFNPFAVSPAGAQGIAQFMPGTARGIGLSDPFDAPAAISAQAHLMRDLLRRFGTVPLALAAYNAGPGAVGACGCVPPIPETRGYVARVLGLMGGAGEPVDGTSHGLIVRLVS